MVGVWHSLFKQVIVDGAARGDAEGMPCFAAYVDGEVAMFIAV